MLPRDQHWLNGNGGCSGTREVKRWLPLSRRRPILLATVAALERVTKLIDIALHRRETVAKRELLAGLAEDVCFRPLSRRDRHGRFLVSLWWISLASYQPPRSSGYLQASRKPFEQLCLSRVSQGLLCHGE